MTITATRKRPPWLSPEDARMLMALPPDARRNMGNLLHQQHRGQAAHDWHCVPLAAEDLELASGARSARAAFGTGGGRVRRRTSADDA